MYSKWSWAFFLITLIQAFIILAFEAYVFGKFQSELRGAASSTTQARTIPTFLTLYIFGFFYQLLLVWDALRLKNTLQIAGLVLYNLGLLIYGAVQLEQVKEAVVFLAGSNEVDIDVWTTGKPFMIAVPCILAFGTCLMAVCAWKLYDEFAWTIYKHISADLRMKKRYLTFQVYIALLKFDFFFFLGFTVQFVVIVTQRRAEFALTIAAIPVTILILVAAAFFCRREILWGTLCVIFLYFAGLGYFVFKLVRMYTPSHEEPYKPARKELTTFAVLTILLILATITYQCMCAANYKKGLRPYVERRKLDNPEDKLSGVSSNNYAPYASPGEVGRPGVPQPMRPVQRMEID